jgi:hypothetical protein
MTTSYDCCECGIHVVSYDDKPPDPRLCCACLHVPGWMHDPWLREVFGCAYSEAEREAWLKRSGGQSL